MKKFKRYIAIALLIAVTAAVSIAAAEPAPVEVIPAPVDLSVFEGIEPDTDYVEDASVTGAVPEPIPPGGVLANGVPSATAVVPASSDPTVFEGLEPDILEDAATPTSIPAPYPAQPPNMEDIAYDDMSEDGVAAVNAPGNRVPDEGYVFPDLSHVAVDILRGDYVPTQSTTLPYTANGTISSYSYTNYKFMPRSTGEINTTFTGTISSGTATVEISLYDCDLGQVVASYSLGNGSGWTNNGRLWYNLNTSHYYCFRVNKTNSGTNTLTFTLNCS
ncbi:MAG: hypothetical protein LBS51_06800 [Oscillospiraceae bacterium]|jgi:hypothetical protein|nr:hypothetical protein [Oscillospiraceae bacterium]